MRFALVGSGVIAPTHVRALLELAGRAELVVCSDVVPARAEALASEFGIKAAPYEDVLADPTIDAVTVCTPSGLHAEVGVPALLAGKHVVVEKPMEVTLEACDRLLAAQAQSGATLAVISQHRFDAASQIVKAAVDDGDLGRLVLAEARVPWYRTQEYYDSGEWRGTYALDGGGALMNQGIHTIDLLRWTCGPVRTVYAQARTAAHERIEVEDVVCATVEFANGAVGTIMASTAAYPGFPARLGVHGTRGGAVIEGDRLATFATVDGVTRAGEAANAHAVQVATGGTRAATKAVDESVVAGAATVGSPADVWGQAHRAQLLDFIDAAEQGRRPLVDGAEGRNAVQLVQAIYESARTGVPVTL
ncbi:Gfo/Idh/MocA family oxidoreductase [Cellulomonas sp. ATA003]|uniref:Gfo/Idh/MocA family protein n=1 Tax=Cellulomonas sp. ATA003 TaxID=3073064 RepID=UPI00287311B9|nr:Gfo/Idh/MocA family oxidoreductase [Cellulomonas sp. ATA003]WNB87233.1 Gfo/Idh/MocA family oxidoreductase [Cellulomonas sp. ATA003]